MFLGGMAVVTVDVMMTLDRDPITERAMCGRCGGLTWGGARGGAGLVRAGQQPPALITPVLITHVLTY